MSARALAVSGLLTVSVLLTAATPGCAGSPERGSPFFRTAQFVAPSAATFAAQERSRRPPRAVKAVPPIPPGGTLPNQRTGAMHDRVVRDICIGC